MRKFILLTFLLLSIPGWLAAQNQVNRSAQRWLKKGHTYTVRKDIHKAEKCYLKSIKKDARNQDAYDALANLYQTQSNFEKATALLRRAVVACPQCAADFAVPLARALYLSQQYEEAEQILNSWIRLHKGKPLSTEIRQLRTNIAFGKNNKNPSTAVPVNMGSRVNSEFDDYFPSITANDSILVFTRKTNGVDEDFYLAERDSCGGWFLARDMGSPPNSSRHEGAQMLSTDQRYLFFMRCDNRSWNGWAEGGCDLYFSYSVKNGWSQPVPFGGMINTPAYEGTPSMSSDNRVMYFASDRPGGYGGLDIWMTVFKDGLWQIPVNLGPRINTAGNEFAPWIAADNKTLYFTSDGHPGFGGNDIFKSEKNENGAWTLAQNLGLPINSPAEDISLCLSTDGKRAYFSSNREGGHGGMDLYEVNLPAAMRPQPVKMIYGIVKDSLTDEIVPYAQLEWYDLTTRARTHHYQSNRGDASYTAVIEPDREFLLKVYRSGYLDYYDTLTFKSGKNYPPDTLPISLLPDYYQAPQTDSLLFRQYFVKNETSISDSVLHIIRNIVEPFINKVDINFYINGFTDDTGTHPVNEELSFARARLIGNVLLDMGIPEANIHIQGWADANPLFPNDSEENRKKNRRVELIVRVPET